MPERAGDLILANRAGYGWTEEMTDDLKVFSTPLITGYKQAIVSDNEKGLWTPFMIVGPGVKKANYLGETPLNMVDQYPTLLRALAVKPSPWVQGKNVQQAWENP